MADPELLQLALQQLLDNACKCSVPGSAVTVSIDSEDQGVAIRTSNTGSFIRSSDVCLRSSALRRRPSLSREARRRHLVPVRHGPDLLHPLLDSTPRPSGMV